MLVATIAELEYIAQRSLRAATHVAQSIKLSAAVTESKHYAMTDNGRVLSNEPGYDDLPPYHGIKAWCAMLSFDLRKSSQRALEIGARDTYITMHTFLPTMLAVVAKANGIVVGLRGDGAIACFGLVETTTGNRVTPDQAEKAVSLACDCGDAMVKTVQQVVNPLLVENEIKGNLMIGVGIDVGDIVGTNIGLGRAQDRTAYGNCVNNACKRSYGNDEVILTYRAQDMFPTNKGGKTSFPKYPGRDDAYILRYPPGYKTVA
jgi:class 3 adenylate cyclase